MDSQESTGPVHLLVYKPTINATCSESEGGADSWERPHLKPIVESRDTIGAESFPPFV
jgi:hypothetical protein